MAIGREIHAAHLRIGSLNAHLPIAIWTRPSSQRDLHRGSRPVRRLAAHGAAARGLRCVVSTRTRIRADRCAAARQIQARTQAPRGIVAGQAARYLVRFEVPHASEPSVQHYASRPFSDWLPAGSYSLAGAESGTTGGNARDRRVGRDNMMGDRFCRRPRTTTCRQVHRSHRAIRSATEGRVPEGSSR